MKEVPKYPLVKGYDLDINKIKSMEWRGDSNVYTKTYIIK